MTVTLLRPTVTLYNAGNAYDLSLVGGAGAATLSDQSDATYLVSKTRPSSGVTEASWADCLFDTGTQIPGNDNVTQVKVFARRAAAQAAYAWINYMFYPLGAAWSDGGNWASITSNTTTIQEWSTIPTLTSTITSNVKAGTLVLGLAPREWTTYQDNILHVHDVWLEVTHEPAPVPPVGTSFDYSSDGYGYSGSGRVFYDPPIAPDPTGVTRERVRRVHQSLPAPNLVDGRPS